MKCETQLTSQVVMSNREPNMSMDMGRVQWWMHIPGPNDLKPKHWQDPEYHDDTNDEQSIMSDIELELRAIVTNSVFV